MARNKRASFTWSRRVASTEGSPIVVADLETFNARAGNVEGAAEDVDFDEGAILLDTNGGGPADVGVSDDEVIVLLASSDFDDEPKSLAKLVKAIEGDKYPEYLVGTVEPKGDLVVDDSANDPASGSKPAFIVPWKAGRYTVVEGHYDEVRGEARWCRITPQGRKEYAKRPPRRRAIPCRKSWHASPSLVRRRKLALSKRRSSSSRSVVRISRSRSPRKPRQHAAPSRPGRAYSRSRRRRTMLERAKHEEG
jgi:hypothetical protein